MVSGRKFYATTQPAFHRLGSCCTHLFRLHGTVFDLIIPAESVRLLPCYAYYRCNSRTPCGMPCYLATKEVCLILAFHRYGSTSHRCCLMLSLASGFTVLIIFSALSRPGFPEPSSVHFQSLAQPGLKCQLLMPDGMQANTSGFA